MPPLTPADGDHSTRETPNKSSGFALGNAYGYPWQITVLQQNNEIVRATRVVALVPLFDCLVIL